MLRASLYTQAASSRKEEEKGEAMFGSREDGTKSRKMKVGGGFIVALHRVSDKIIMNDGQNNSTKHTRCEQGFSAYDEKGIGGYEFFDQISGRRIQSKGAIVKQSEDEHRMLPTGQICSRCVTIKRGC